jgi:hypothetical protein
MITGDTWWALQSEGMFVIYLTENQARDNMTRKDKLVSFQITNMQEHES